MFFDLKKVIVVEGGGAPSRRPSVRPYLCASEPAAPPLYTQNTFKRSKQFKINGLGHFRGTHLRLFVYKHIKKYAPMQRGVRFDMCPFGPGAFHMGSKKRSKPL